MGWDTAAKDWQPLGGQVLAPAQAEATVLSSAGYLVWQALLAVLAAKHLAKRGLAGTQIGR